MKLLLIIAFCLCFTVSSVAQTRETCLSNHESENRYASYSPDGSKILFESNRNGNWDLFTMLPDGTEQTLIPTSSLNSRRPSWHPDGSKIVFEDVENNQLIELMLENGEESVLLDEKSLNSNVLYGKMHFARFSPKGDKLSFTLQESDTIMNLMIMDLKRKSLEEVFYNPFRTAYSNWGPKGNSIIFHSRHETNNADDNIYRINLKDNSIRRMTDWSRHDFCPVYSPDGKKIAFARSMEDRRPEIFISEKGVETRLTDNEDGDTLPSWSPDGSHLLITAYRNGSYQICKITVD